MLTTLLTLTFDEFVQYGLDQNSNIVDGVPWSFDFQGLPVSHETNDKYLITTPGGVVPLNRYETITYSGSPKSITVFSLGGGVGHDLYDRVSEKHRSKNHWNVRATQKTGVLPLHSYLC